MRRFDFPLTARQRKLVESKARILVIGAGTKTGKSLALFYWLIRGMLEGQACCYVGPYYFRSRAAFDEIKKLLQPWVLDRIVKVNEARLQITSMNGGRIDFISGDNEQTLYGQNFQRIVLDESSRMSEIVYTAALTTISGTGGRLRLAFNLDLGSRNWSVRHLLRIQALTPEERERTGEDYMCFPTGGDGLVSDETVEQFKKQMPRQLWEALYLAVIPESDCSLFHNLDEIFTGRELAEPEMGKTYYLGLDLARKADFTCATIMDEDGNAVYGERFSQMDWSLQVGRATILYRTFGCVKCICDATGLGDPVCEALEELQLNVERFVFTVPSRKALIEELVLACDGREISIPNTERFQVYRQEMEAFEYVLDGTSIKYAAPSGMHDDTVMSLALVTHGVRAARGLVLGLLLTLQKRAKEIADGLRDRWGELIHKPKPKPLLEVVAKAAIVRSEAPPKKANDPCPHCQSTSTILMSAGVGKFVLHCNACAADDGQLPAQRAGACCGNFLPQRVSGMTRCGNCGRQVPDGPVIANAATFADLHARRNSLGRGSFGRFG
jgi:hypothetical protein